MSFNNIKHYPSQFLQNLSQDELVRLAKNCIKSTDKDYELLAKISKMFLDYSYHSLLYKIVSQLDAKALETVVNNLSETSKESFSSGTEHILSQLWEQARGFDHINLEEDATNKQIASMAKTFLQHKKEINANDLEKYATFASQREFYQLVGQRQIDLSKMNIELQHYDIAYQKPLLPGMKYNSIEDVLLTHTYSKSKTLEEVKAIYSNLLSSSTVASDIMHITAINLINGNNLNIIFEPKMSSSYDLSHNIVRVGEVGGRSTTETITIHELGHYTLFKILPFSNGMPFDIFWLKAIKDTYASMKRDLYSMNAGGDINFDLLQIATEHDNVVKTFDEIHKKTIPIVEYELAAKKVIIKAGELMGMKSEQFKPYFMSKEFVNFLKDNSPIDLFHDNASARYGKVKKTNHKPDSKELSLGLKKAFWDAYSQGVDQCPNNQKKFLPSQEQIFQYVREEYLPGIIKKLDLNDDKIFFLERIADLVNREEDIYKVGYNYNSDGYALYQELIVRYAELKAAGIEEGLLDSFSDLVYYWQENITPIIEKARAEFLSEQKPLDFLYKTVLDNEENPVGDAVTEKITTIKPPSNMCPLDNYEMINNSTVGDSSPLPIDLT